MISVTVLLLSTFIVHSFSSDVSGPTSSQSGHSLATAYSQQLLDCFNNGADELSEPPDFQSFLAGDPVKLRLERVWWSHKHSKLPLTIFTHATFDRLPLLEAQCRSYSGPLSAALYLPLRVGARRRKLNDGIEQSSAESHHSPNHIAEVQNAIDRLQETFIRLEAQPSACSVVLMLFTERVADNALAALMPTNALRNAALMTVNTPLAAMVDADLSASRSLSRLASNATRVNELVTGSVRDRIMWIMPAWETNAKLEMQVANRMVDLALEGDKALLASLYRNGSNAIVKELIRYESSAVSTSSGSGGQGAAASGSQPEDQKATDKTQEGRHMHGVFGHRERRWNSGRKSLLGRPGTGQISAETERWEADVGLGGSGAGSRAQRRLQEQAKSEEFKMEEEEEEEEEQGSWEPLFPFDSQDFCQGHGSTDFHRFLHEDAPYRVEYTSGFEPWYIAARETIYPYDERLRGWYGDKVQQVLYSILRGHRFWVLPDVWIIHRPHKPVAARSIIRNETGAPSQDLEAFAEVMRWHMIPYTKFLLYKMRMRNIEYRLRKLAPLNLFRRRVGTAFERCMAELPWWQKRRAL